MKNAHNSSFNQNKRRVEVGVEVQVDDKQGFEVKRSTDGIDRASRGEKPTSTLPVCQNHGENGIYRASRRVEAPVEETAYTELHVEEQGEGPHQRSTGGLCQPKKQKVHFHEGKTHKRRGEEKCKGCATDKTEKL